jgi:ATP-dependent DNA ligase
MSHQRTLPVGFIAPCLPTNTDKLPSGDLWLHEIKHDGFRMLVRRDAAGVRLFTRNGHDWTGHMLFRFCGKLSPRRP